MSADNYLTIGEIAQVFDGPHATPKKIECGPYFLSISSLENGALDLSKSAHLSEDDFSKWTRRVTPQEGDVLFSYETRLGDAALMPPNIVACLGRRMGLLRPDRCRIIPEYLLYAYLSPDFQETIRANTIHGATVDRIALKEMPSFPIRVPSIDEQKNVVSILKSIDGKIETNRQINQTLEQIAQAIFKSWFVDFEPVKAKIVARETLVSDNPTATAEQIHDAEQQAAIKAICGAGNVIPTEQLQTLADLFPNQLVESELGEIPEGWKVVDTKSISNKISKGTTPRKKDMQEAADPASIKFLKVRDIADNGDIDASSLDLIPNSVHTGAIKRSILELDDVVFSIAGTIGRVSVIGSELENANCNQAVAFIRLSESEQYKDFLYLLLKTPGVQELVKSKVVQGVQANFSLTELGSIQFAKCDDLLLKYFNKVVGTLFSEKQNLSISTATLVNLRDSLLPKLLSGEIELATNQKDIVNA